MKCRDGEVGDAALPGGRDSVVGLVTGMGLERVCLVRGSALKRAGPRARQELKLSAYRAIGAPRANPWSASRTRAASSARPVNQPPATVIAPRVLPQWGRGAPSDLPIVRSASVGTLAGRLAFRRHFLPRRAEPAGWIPRHTRSRLGVLGGTLIYRCRRSRWVGTVLTDEGPCGGQSAHQRPCHRPLAGADTPSPGMTGWDGWMDSRGGGMDGQPW